MNATLANLVLALEEGAAGTDSGGGSSMWIPLVAMGAIFYFLMIAPERKQRKARQAMLDAVKKGDSVMTTGGIMGTVANVEESRVTVQVSDGVRMRFSRQAIQAVLDEDGNPLGGEPPKKS